MTIKNINKLALDDIYIGGLDTVMELIISMVSLGTNSLMKSYVSHIKFRITVYNVQKIEKKT